MYLLPWSPLILSVPSGTSSLTSVLSVASSRMTPWCITSLSPAPKQPVKFCEILWTTASRWLVNPIYVFFYNQNYILFINISASNMRLSSGLSSSCWCQYVTWSIMSAMRIISDRRAQCQVSNQASYETDRLSRTYRSKYGLSRGKLQAEPRLRISSAAYWCQQLEVRREEDVTFQAKMLTNCMLFWL